MEMCRKVFTSKMNSSWAQKSCGGVYKWGYPKWMVYFMENPSKNGWWLGYPHFRKTPENTLLVNRVPQFLIKIWWFRIIFRFFICLGNGSPLPHVQTCSNTAISTPKKGMVFDHRMNVGPLDAPETGLSGCHFCQVLGLKSCKMLGSLVQCASDNLEIPFGKLHSYGKVPLLIGKLFINAPYSIAMLV